ncbi:hypothetical protein [Chloroflexus sp.]|uniref:hypothetical protein n=1 Tax=Chloroflexus sp. TaxID=1904827 RepID=UPI00298F3E19|nr:hypothetical protein [Chloroflexus sp.]MDW8403412.1 hypothetical protein [Chloroflexus sp.]
MIPRRYHSRLYAIALPQAVMIVTALIVAATQPPPPIILIAMVKMIGYTANICFWLLCFAAYPALAPAHRSYLTILYWIGASALVVAIGLAIWGVSTRFANSLFWLFTLFALVELTQYFAIRWIDGQGRWWWRYPPARWRGGAAGVTLRRLGTQNLPARD